MTTALGLGLGVPFVNPNMGSAELVPVYTPIFREDLPTGLIRPLIGETEALPGTGIWEAYIDAADSGIRINSTSNIAKNVDGEGDPNGYAVNFACPVVDEFRLTWTFNKVDVTGTKPFEIHFDVTDAGVGSENYKLIRYIDTNDDLYLRAQGAGNVLTMPGVIPGDTHFTVELYHNRTTNTSVIHVGGVEVATHVWAQPDNGGSGIGLRTAAFSGNNHHDAPILVEQITYA